MIRFEYDFLRSDQIPTYRTGIRQANVRRLNQVLVESQGTVIRSYILEYSASSISGRSLLVSVHERNAA